MGELTSRRSGGSGPGLILGAAALFGSTGTAQALGPDGSDPFSVGLLRLLVGGSGLVVVALIRGRTHLRNVPYGPAAVGALAVLGYQLAFFAGVRESGVAVGTLVTIGSAPVLSGVVAWAALGERPTRRWLASTLVAVGGIGLIAGPSGAAPLLGIALNLAAGMSYAVFVTASKRLLDTQTPLDAMAIVFGCGAVLAGAMMPLADLAFLTSTSGLAMALWLGFATTTLAYVLYGFGLRHTTVGTAATLTLFEPVVATTLGVVVLAERPRTLGWLGMLLVMIGLGLLVKRG